MITLYCGGSSQQEGQQADLLVSSVHDYVAAREAIRNSLVSGTDLEILISNTVIQNWFWDLAEYKAFRIYDQDLRHELTKKLGVTLPDKITSGLIEELDLLSEEDPNESVLAATQWIAEKRLDAVWSQEYPSKEHIRTLIDWYVSQDISQISSEIWIVIEEQLSRWAEITSGSLKKLYSALRIDPTDIVNFLCAWDALSSYPPGVRETWLESIGWYTDDREGLAAELNGLPPNPTIDEELKTLVIPYWNHRLNKLIEKIIHDSQ